jgi:CDP-diacylglycerol---glycerol-3-phosphate 3-phosphatidyltransferase
VVGRRFPPECYFRGVIDLHVRPRVTRFIQPLGRGLARIGLTPTAVSFLGLAVSVAGAAIIATGRLRTGAFVVLAGSLLDGLDGAVARASGRVTGRGAFLDAAFDRVAEIAAFGGLAVAMDGEPRVLLLIVLSLGGALLVPYMRARAEAIGFDGRGGLTGRAERILLFCLGLITGLVEPMLWIFVALVWLTAFSRFWKTYRSIE